MKDWNKVSGRVLLSISIFLTILQLNVTNAPGWSIQTVDNQGTVGWGTSIATDSNRKVHISYNDYGNNQLKYATNISGSWVAYSLASANVGPYTLTTSIAVDLNNKVHISYYDGGLNYITNASGPWITEVVDGEGNININCSIALDSNNKIHISYLDNTNNEIKYATNASGSWTKSTIDAAGGEGTSIAVDSNNKVHISYASGGLKYATNASGSWQSYDIDSVGLYTTSLGIDSDNGIHIGYYTGSSLKYATNSSGSWITSTIDGLEDVGEYAGIAVDSNNKVHISYYDRTNGGLKYATNISGSWVTNTVDNTSKNSGECTSIAVDSNNQVHISYLDLSNTDIRYATNAHLDMVYVSRDDHCYGNYPCWNNIQNGIGQVHGPSMIEITQETYDEDIVLNVNEEITLEGGWDTNFTSSSSYTSIIGSITIINGTMIIKNIKLSTPPASWISLNTPIGSFFGFNANACNGCGQDFQAVGGTAYQFIIDPPSVGKSGNPRVMVGDRLQATPCDSITLSVLDANDIKTGQTIPMTAGGSATYFSQWPKLFIYTGQRLLLELTPAKTMLMMIYWD